MLAPSTWSALLCSAIALPAAAVSPTTTPAPAAAVFPLTTKNGVSADSGDVLSDTLVEELRKTRAFSRVVSFREVEAALGLEKQKQLLNCSDTACLAEIGGTLGVDIIVVGTVGRLGRAAVFNAKFLNAHTGNAVSSLSVQTCGDSDEYLLRSLPHIAASLATQANLSSLAVPQAPPALCPEPTAMTAPRPEPAATEPTTPSPWPLVLTGAGMMTVGVLLVVPVLLSVALAGATTYVINSKEALAAIDTGSVKGDQRWLLLRAPIPISLAAAVAGSALSVLMVLVGAAGCATGIFRSR
jgi:TolB-like protein